MKKQEIFFKVQQCLARVFGLNSLEISLQSSTDNTPNWDSLGHLRLIMDIEAEFGISFSTEDIPKLVTVDIICDSIEEYRA